MTDKLDQQLAGLGTMSPAQLRAEWTRQHRAVPPPYHADLLVRGLAYRIQEKATGGLPPAARRTLDRLGRQLAETGRIELERELRIKPGTRLVRAWGGKTHHVLVGETGYTFQDRHYASLSRIAQEITGAKWSGPRFFGLVRGADQRG